MKPGCNKLRKSKPKHEINLSSVGREQKNNKPSRSSYAYTNFAIMCSEAMVGMRTNTSIGEVEATPYTATCTVLTSNCMLFAS